MTSVSSTAQGAECAGTAACTPRAPLAAGAAAGKILVVEDEPEILEPLAYSLRQAGFSVLCAADGLTACRLIGSEQPELVLLDIMLPDLDGWEVCRLLRQHPDPLVACIPVIMLTALNAPEDKYRGLEIGADLFLAKPYSIREVILHAGKQIRYRRKTLALENRLARLADHDQQSQQMHHLLFHELRNQLLILNGYAQLLHKNPAGEQAETCRDAIQRSSTYLQNLAEEVLLIRQLADGELILPVESFRLEELVQEIIHIYRPAAQEKSMQLTLVCDGQRQAAHLNRAALKIILSALVDNSLKYGPAGQTVTLRCQHEQTRLVIIVADQGAGIPAEDLERIFQPYFRREHPDGQVRGNGLGLHAVQVLTRAMGGSVDVTSSPGPGSRFRLCLPNQLPAATTKDCP